MLIMSSCRNILTKGVAEKVDGPEMWLVTFFLENSYCYVYLKCIIMFSGAVFLMKPCLGM